MSNNLTYGIHISMHLRTGSSVHLHWEAVAAQTQPLVQTRQLCRCRSVSPNIHCQIGTSGRVHAAVVPIEMNGTACTQMHRTLHPMWAKMALHKSVRIGRSACIKTNIYGQHCRAELTKRQSRTESIGSGSKVVAFLFIVIDHIFFSSNIYTLGLIHKALTTL